MTAFRRWLYLETPDWPLVWAVFFGLFFVATWWLNTLISPLVDVLPGRVALLFLPAFVRVVAVVVAGAAGVAGIFLGSFFVGVWLAGDPFSIALANGISSALAPWLAYALVRSFWPRVGQGQSGLPWTFFITLSVVCSILNALVHGVSWSGVVQSVGLIHLVAMMLGDLTGVLAGLGLVRLLFWACPGCLPRIMRWLQDKASPPASGSSA